MGCGVIHPLNDAVQYFICRFEYHAVDSLPDEDQLHRIGQAADQFADRERIEAELDFIGGKQFGWRRTLVANSSLVIEHMPFAVRRLEEAVNGAGNDNRNFAVRWLDL